MTNRLKLKSGLLANDGRGEDITKVNLFIVVLIIAFKIHDRNTSLFVYYYNGSRSEQAVVYLKESRYTNVANIGGIVNYRSEKI